MGETTIVRGAAPAAAGTLEQLMSVTASGVMRDVFIGRGHDYGALRMYGGHLLGQSLAAGLATVGRSMLAHSLHASFLKTGAPDADIGYQVERLRDGRHYATRLVRAVQADQVLMVATASFKTAEPGDEHQPEMPRVPAPATLARRNRRSGFGALSLPFTAGLGVELLPVDGWRPQAPPTATAAITLWMRCALSPDADPRLRQCVLAYLSDGTLMFNALRCHGTAFGTHRTTSLDHTLWFHAPADPAQWLLFDQTSPAAGDSRGLNQGHVFSAEGRLVASVAQESMMRRL